MMTESGYVRPLITYPRPCDVDHSCNNSQRQQWQGAVVEISRGETAGVERMFYIGHKCDVN